MNSTNLFDESWFYVPDLSEAAIDASTPVEIPMEEAHHAFQVLRLREGQSIVVTNGMGEVVEGNLSGNSKKANFISLRRHRDKIAAPLASLAMSLLKGKDTEDPIAACCQLPLSDVYLIRADHSQIFAGQEHEKLLQRLRQKSIVALKQARKSYLTRIHAPMTLAQWREKNPQTWMVIAHPGPDTFPEKPTEAFSLFVGPEGGFSSAEMMWFENQSASYRLGLGKTRLRAEQAPLIGLGKLLGMDWLE